jgi:hypothetical protein
LLVFDDVYVHVKWKKTSGWAVSYRNGIPSISDSEEKRKKAKKKIGDRNLLIIENYHTSIVIQAIKRDI